MRTAQVGAVEEKNHPDELELRESDALWPKTEDELIKYIRALVDRPHTYGTCVYAVSLSAVATFHYVAHRLGITGFQAGCADMDVLRRTRGMKNGFRIVNYDNLLYPQYLDDEHFPGWEKLIAENRVELSKQAKKLLKERGPVAVRVREHWKYLASLGK